MTSFPVHDHPLLAGAGIRHGWTDARGPDFGSDPAGPEQARDAAALGRAVGLARAAWARQVHAGTVLRVRRAGLAGDADALWTDEPGLGVVGRSADCPLVLVAGSRADGSVVAGFAHASWRSTVQGIAASLVAAMTRHGTGALRAVICPSAGPCCYEVGDEVREAFRAALGPDADRHFRAGKDRPHLDLWAANRSQLRAGGVADDRIAVVGVCTICGRGYPSHRREGARAARFAAAVGPAAG